MSVVFVLCVTVLGQPEQRWKSYARIEECLEVARAVTLHRDSITARCVRVEEKNKESK